MKVKYLFLGGELWMNNKNQLLLVATIAASLLLTAPRVSLAVPVSFQEGIGGYAGTDDTMLASWPGAESLSFGGRQNWDVGSFSTTSSAFSNALLRYDLTSLDTTYPDGFIVNSATLRLTTSDVAFNADALGTVQVRLLDNANAAWVEGTSVGTLEEGASIWHRRIAGAGGAPGGAGNVIWSGGSGAVSSNGATVLGSAAMVNTTDTTMDIDLTGGSLSFINDWASGGTNGGFYLRADDLSASAGGRQSFYSSETPTFSNRPELILDLTALVPPPVGGPADFRVWEEDFEDNLDPVQQNPNDWSSIHVTTIAGGMAEWDGATPWKLVDSAPHFFNGVTTVDMDFAVHPGLIGPETSDRGVGWFANVGSDAATSDTSGYIGVNAFLARDATGQFVQFNENTNPGQNVVPVAEGPVSVSTTITILGGNAGALVEYSIVDSSGGSPITGSYTQANLTGQHGITTPFFTYTNFALGQGAIDYLKVANTPNGDFDVDLDADGSDFLKWQRDLGTAASLALWESDFGSAVPLVGSVIGAVPEPSTVSLMLSSLLAFVRPRKRQKHLCG